MILECHPRSNFFCFETKKFPFFSFFFVSSFSIEIHPLLSFLAFTVEEVVPLYGPWQWAPCTLPPHCLGWWWGPGPPIREREGPRPSVYRKTQTTGPNCACSSRRMVRMGDPCNASGSPPNRSFCTHTVGSGVVGSLLSPLSTPMCASIVSSSSPPPPFGTIAAGSAAGVLVRCSTPHAGPHPPVCSPPSRGRIRRFAGHRPTPGHTPGHTTPVASTVVHRIVLSPQKDKKDHPAPILRQACSSGQWKPSSRSRKFWRVSVVCSYG